MTDVLDKKLSSNVVLQNPGEWLCNFLADNDHMSKIVGQIGGAISVNL